ncbi:hypothetical protein CFC21_096816 [Triticum aestivum]|uniref:Uncharacterized protein n=3 Tax=Triticum TaxID=4564 RepID=A0A9R0Z6C8_TRITD|nr:hypothetical protein CFC21_096816 [Triticum aestivum]VAI72155.1 unnamed protein product [Triticum turgidum subsp. durum]
MALERDQRARHPLMQRWPEAWSSFHEVSDVLWPTTKGLCAAEIELHAVKKAVDGDEDGAAEQLKADKEGYELRAQQQPAAELPRPKQFLYHEFDRSHEHPDSLSVSFLPGGKRSLTG